MSRTDKSLKYLHELNGHQGGIEYRDYPDLTRPIVEDLVQAPGPGEKGLAIQMGHSVYNTIQGHGVKWVPDEIPSFDVLDDAYERPLGPGPIALTSPGFTPEQFGIAGILDLRMHRYPFVRRFGSLSVNSALDGISGHLAALRLDWEQSYAQWTWPTGRDRKLGTTAVRDAITAFHQNLLGYRYPEYVEYCQSQALRCAEDKQPSDQ